MSMTTILETKRGSRRRRDGDIVDITVVTRASEERSKVRMFRMTSGRMVALVGIVAPVGWGALLASDSTVLWIKRQL